jgi:hypothetical protein
MEGRSTWSGRERSSHSRFPPVPRVRLVTFHFLPFYLRGFLRAVFCNIPSDFSSLAINAGFVVRVENKRGQSGFASL